MLARAVLPQVVAFVNGQGDASRALGAAALWHDQRRAPFLVPCDLVALHCQKSVGPDRALCASHLLVARARHHHFISRTAFFPLV